MMCTDPPNTHKQSTQYAWVTQWGSDVVFGQEFSEQVFHPTAEALRTAHCLLFFVKVFGLRKAFLSRWSFLPFQSFHPLLFSEKKRPSDSILTSLFMGAFWWGATEWEQAQKHREKRSQLILLAGSCAVVGQRSSSFRVPVALHLLHCKDHFIVCFDLMLVHPLHWLQCHVLKTVEQCCSSGPLGLHEAATETKKISKCRSARNGNSFNGHRGWSYLCLGPPACTTGPSLNGRTYLSKHQYVWFSWKCTVEVPPTKKRNKQINKMNKCQTNIVCIYVCIYLFAF